MSLRSWLASNKTAFVHAVSVGSMLIGSVLKRQGNPGLMAGITAATAAFHIGEGLAKGGTAGLKEVTDSLGELAGQAKGFAGDLLGDTSDVVDGAAKKL